MTDTEGQSRILTTGGEAVTKKVCQKNKNLRTCYAEDTQAAQRKLKLGQYRRLDVSSLGAESILHLAQDTRLGASFISMSDSFAQIASSLASVARGFHVRGWV